MEWTALALGSLQHAQNLRKNTIEVKRYFHDTRGEGSDDRQPAGQPRLVPNPLAQICLQRIIPRAILLQQATVRIHSDRSETGTAC